MGLSLISGFVWATSFSFQLRMDCGLYRGPFAFFIARMPISPRARRKHLPLRNAAYFGALCNAQLQVPRTVRSRICKLGPRLGTGSVKQVSKSCDALAMRCLLSRQHAWLVCLPAHPAYHSPRCATPIFFYQKMTTAFHAANKTNKQKRCTL